MRAWLCRFSFFLSGSLSAPAAKPLLLGLASISGGIETLYVTKKTGAFKRNGLHVDFLVLQGGSQALQVLFVRRNKIDQRKTCVESTPSYG
ncbi:MAG TPA: hypothetical protein VFD87_11090 [Phototrophicaceae bacterium]|nr:hypothetical protein [Phototrophicaceae bacterium]